MLDNIKSFCKAQASNIIVTLIGGLIPVIFQFIFSPKEGSGESCKCGFWALESLNYGFQSIFIFTSLYVLIKIRKNIIHDIRDSECQIQQYMMKHCGLKIYDRNTVKSAFHTVQETASQFFYAWLAVWMIWLISYAGEFCINFCIGNSNTIIKIYGQIFDFLNSTALFIVYIILTSVTVNHKRRSKNDYAYLESILVWTLLFILFLVGIIVEAHGGNTRITSVLPFYTSVVSAVTFIIVLSKLSSVYLQIPSFFMFSLYLYAIIQLYLPFSDFKLQGCLTWTNVYLQGLFSYITLFGKVMLMLTLCWIAVRRRFIFYVIHRSTMIDRADELLSELNKEKVSF